MNTALGASRLPQLHGRPMVTDGGMETDLTFHHGVDLPHFAAFPLLESAGGRALLEDYYNGYAAIARRAGAGLMLEAPTWRANPDWGRRLGYSAADLAGVQMAAITLLARLRERYAAAITDVVLSGEVGPQGDGYEPSQLDPGAAAAYHRPQIEALAQAGADMVTAYTLTGTGEAIGIVQAARAVGLPVAVSFTVETDGQLPGGVPLAQAILDADADAAGPDYFLVNCAYPAHIEPALAEPGTWRERIIGVRYNASVKSHAELDQATELDVGDPRLLSAAHHRLRPLLPHLSIVGGCCGTDARHVATLWGVDQQASS